MRSVRSGSFARLRFGLMWCSRNFGAKCPALVLARGGTRELLSGLRALGLDRSRGIEAPLAQIARAAGGFPRIGPGHVWKVPESEPDGVAPVRDPQRPGPGLASGRRQRASFAIASRARSFLRVLCKLS